MRGLVLFFAGILVGLAAQTTVAQNQGGPGGVHMMNHVAIAVPSIPEAIEYYTQKLGYRVAFRGNPGPDGQPRMAYLHISRDTFLELGQTAPDRPAGFQHYGLHVENTPAAVEFFRKRGLTVTDAVVSTNAGSGVATITDPYMGRIELVEYRPESLHRKAIDAWKP